MARTKDTPNDPERRERILHATIDVLRDAGVAAVSARSVAARAGVPVGSVSYHFASVRALLLDAAHTVIEMRAESLREWGTTVTEQNVLQRLAELIHTQITTGRGFTVVAYELYILGLRDPDFQSLSVAATTSLSRQLSTYVPDVDAQRLAVAADGLQLHSLFLTPPPSPSQLAAALARQDV